MQMKSLKSSNIDSVGYDAATRTMHVVFKGKDTVYEHYDVGPDDHVSFVHDPSPGAHYSRHIRGKFKVTKL